MTDTKLSNLEMFKKLTTENKTKLVAAISEVTGRKEKTVYQRWLYDDITPDKYKDLVTKGLNKIYSTQIKEEEKFEDQLEKLLN